MKKLIALLAALTMLFACGCGNNGKDTDNGTNNTPENSTVDERGDTDNNTVGDDVREGMDDAGNAVKDAADGAGDAVGGALDDADRALTGENGAGTETAPQENP